MPVKKKVIKKKPVAKAVLPDPVEPVVERVAAKALGIHEILGQDNVKSMLEVAANRNMAALLVGDTGTGKTTIIKSIADAQNQDYIRYNLTGETTVDEFVGKYELRDHETVWVDGILLQAMKQGKWLIVDEINVALPEILFVLHPLLDDEKAVRVANHHGEVVKPHQNFRFFATMNPVDEYAGTKDLNKAFKSRFNMIINMDYPSPSVEARVVSGKGGVDEETGTKLVDVGVFIRQAKAKGEVFYTCSTRDLILWAQLIGDLGFNEAFRVTIMSKAENDRDAVNKIFKDVTGQYLKLEADGYKPSIEFFVEQAEKLSKVKDDLEKRKDKIKEEVTADLFAKLNEKKKTEEGQQPTELPQF